VIDAHRAILDSLKSADAEVAGNWMRKHMADFKRGYELAGYSPEKRLVQPEAAAADR
jgi:DNA-binding GntR family transcriptional regulator